MPVGNDGIRLLAAGTRQRIAATWGDRPAQAGRRGKGLGPWLMLGVQPNSTLHRVYRHYDAQELAMDRIARNVSRSSCSMPWLLILTMTVSVRVLM